MSEITKIFKGLPKRFNKANVKVGLVTLAAQSKIPKHFLESLREKAGPECEIVDLDHEVQYDDNNGSGINSDDAHRIFDPYFTTKPEGSGLGLSSVWGFVKQCGGHIRLQTQPGEGSTFSLFFPVTPA